MDLTWLVIPLAWCRREYFASQSSVFLGNTFALSHELWIMESGTASQISTTHTMPS